MRGVEATKDERDREAHFNLDTARLLDACFNVPDALNPHTVVARCRYAIAVELMHFLGEEKAKGAIEAIKARADTGQLFGIPADVDIDDLMAASIALKMAPRPKEKRKPKRK